MPDLSKPQIIPYAEESVDMTLFDCRWVPCSTRFVALGTHLKGTGVLRVYSLDVEKKGVKQLSEVTTEHPIKCGTFGAATLEERHLATGDFKVTIHIVFALPCLNQYYSAKLTIYERNIFYTKSHFQSKRYVFFF